MPFNAGLELAVEFTHAFADGPLGESVFGGDLSVGHVPETRCVPQSFRGTCVDRCMSLVVGGGFQLLQQTV
jgi:hypothetical protein